MSIIGQLLIDDSHADNHYRLENLENKRNTSNRKRNSLGDNYFEDNNIMPPAGVPRFAGIKQIQQKEFVKFRDKFR